MCFALYQQIADFLHLDGCGHSRIHDASPVFDVHDGFDREGIACAQCGNTALCARLRTEPRVIRDTPVRSVEHRVSDRRSR